MMLLTNSRPVMGDKVNGPWLNALSWVTTAAVSAAAVGLVVTWVAR
jgi:Mn2+/Fe2+ NRAMP family transporter